MSLPLPPSLKQTACQDSDDDDVDDEQQQAEFDAMLIEYAGDILPSLAAAMGGPQFAPYFAGFLPFLLKKSVSNAVPGGIKLRFLQPDTKTKL